MKVSVVVPAYQAASLIGRALGSIAAQTTRPAQVIVVDDGSTDDLAAVVAEYDDVTLIQQANAGVGAARNTGIRASTGDWVVFLDADDYWAPTRLEAIAAHHARHPEHGVITTDALVVDGEGEVRWRYYERIEFANDNQRRALMRGNFVYVSAAVKRSLLERVGGFDEDRLGSAAADWDMWLRLALDGTSIGLVDEPLAYYVQHGANMSEDVFGMRRSELRVLDRAVRRSDLSVAERSQVRRLRHERARSLLRADYERLANRSVAATAWLLETVHGDRRSERLRGIVGVARSRVGG